MNIYAQPIVKNTTRATASIQGQEKGVGHFPDLVIPIDPPNCDISAYQSDE